MTHLRKYILDLKTEINILSKDNKSKLSSQIKLINTILMNTDNDGNFGLEDNFNTTYKNFTVRSTYIYKIIATI